MTTPGRGYDSYDPDEAKRQTVERRVVDSSQTNFGDQLFGRPGSINERIRVGVVAAIPVAFGAGFLESRVFFPVFGMTFVVTFIAVTGADWLARPYRGRASHGLIIGLTSAALFLALLLAGMMTTLFVVLPEVHGGYLHAAAAIFTLFLAVPAWLLWLLWGLFRRGRTEAAANRPIWRLSLAPLVILGTLLLLARVAGGL